MDPEPLILPLSVQPNVRLLRPAEVLSSDDHYALRADVARGQAAIFTTGCVLKETDWLG